MANEEKKLVEIENLRKYFPIKGTNGPGVQAVQDVSLYIKKGETLGLVGESGCGKTTLGRTILRLYEPTGGKIIYDGQTIFDNPLDKDGKPLGKAKSVNMLPYRKKMQIIFQDPSASLDPRMTVGEIIGEAIDIHKLAANKKDRADMIKGLLARVGLNTEHANRYPHEFSGGQQQRVGIARALAVKPEFIVCDEPISALDVSIQSQVVNMLEDMQAEMGLTYHVDHVTVVCCCFRVCQTFPGIFEISCCYGLSVRPFDTITKMYSISYCSVIVCLFIPGFSLSWNCNSISFTVVCPFDQTFEHMVAHDRTIHCCIQCRVDTLWFRCDTEIQIKSVC